MNAFNDSIEDVQAIFETLLSKQGKTETLPREGVGRSFVDCLLVQGFRVRVVLTFKQISATLELGEEVAVLERMLIRKRLLDFLERRRLGTDCLVDQVQSVAPPVFAAGELFVSGNVTRQDAEPVGHLAGRKLLLAENFQRGRIHRTHATRSEEVVQKVNEALQTLTAGAREPEEMVDVVEPVDDFIPDSLFSAQLAFSRVALLDELPELGAGVGRTQLCGVRNLLGEHRCPPGREAVEDPASLHRQFLDSGLEVWRLARR